MATDIITSIVTGGVNEHPTTSEEANSFASDFITTPGIVSAITNTGGVSPATGGFAVNQSSTPAMTVDITLGRAYVLGTPSGQSSQILRAKMASNYIAYDIAANTSGSTKYDWIYLKLDADKAAAPSLTADDVITLYTSRSTSNSTDNGTAPTYGLVLAVVTVANGASSIVNANIADKRVNTTITMDSLIIKDGTLKNWDGWITPDETWTYASASTFTVAGDRTTKYTKGTRLKWTQTTVKYGVVASSSYSAPNTTVTIAVNTDHTIANEVITANYYSYAANPQGYPGWFNYTPTLTNLSGGTQIFAYFSIIGLDVFFEFKYALAGAGVDGSVSISVPVAMSVSTVNDNINNVCKYISAGNSYFGYSRPTSSTVLNLFVAKSDGTYMNIAVLSSTVPATWRNGDFVTVSGNYKMA